jgi:hypothetical protein
LARQKRRASIGTSRSLGHRAARRLAGHRSPLPPSGVSAAKLSLRGIGFLDFLRSGHMEVNTWSRTSRRRPFGPFLAASNAPSSALSLGGAAEPIAQKGQRTASPLPSKTSGRRAETGQLRPRSPRSAARSVAEGSTTRGEALKSSKLSRCEDSTVHDQGFAPRA